MANLFANTRMGTAALYSSTAFTFLNITNSIAAQLTMLAIRIKVTAVPFSAASRMNITVTANAITTR